MQSPLEQANSFIWQVRLGQFWSSSAALAQSFSPSHTKLNGTQRGWPGYQVGHVNWLELQVRWPAGDRERIRRVNQGRINYIIDNTFVLKSGFKTTCDKNVCGGIQMRHVIELRKKQI